MSPDSRLAASRDSTMTVPRMAWSSSSRRSGVQAPTAQTRAVGLSQWPRRMGWEELVTVMTTSAPVTACSAVEVARAPVWAAKDAACWGERLQMRRSLKLRRWASAAK